MTAMTPSNWTARLTLGLLLLLAGAGLSIWGLSRWEAGARFFGVAPPPARLALAPVTLAPVPVAAPIAPGATDPDAAVRLAALETRLRTVEDATRRAEGSAGRADSLLIAFAARRAIERGLALGYLEPLLQTRFGAAHQGAVATVISAARSPRTLDQLVGEYGTLGTILKGPGSDEDWWAAMQREMGDLISIHRADRPNPAPAARFERALNALRGGKVAEALAETMRLPGASRPAVQPWIARARQRIAVEAALDRLESDALMGESVKG